MKTAKFQSFFDLMKSSFRRFQECNVRDMGAALSYFTIFSLVPLLTVLITLIGFVIGVEKIQQDIVEAFGSLAGSDAAAFMSQTLLGSSSGEFSLISSLAAGLALFLGVIVITSQLQASFDKIFDYTPDKLGFKKMMRERVATFSIVLILAVFMLSFIVLSTGISFFGSFIDLGTKYGSTYSYVVNFLLTFLFVFGFSLINFRFLPHIRLPWKSVMIGSTMTSLLFMIGKIVISLYLVYSDPGSAYGTAGVILVILAWIYYSSQILFFGASVTYAHHIKTEIQSSNFEKKAL